VNIILSHDIDHLHSIEHWRDVYWPGVWYRGAIAIAQRQISLVTYLKRAWPLQRLERIKEVLDMDQSVGGKPTFFFGVRKGLRLSYSNHSLKPIIYNLISNGIPLGLHGMAFNDQTGMQEEFDDFVLLTGDFPMGIRNHYLRLSENTLKYQSKLGYSYDSTTYEVRAPYRVNAMWEFPITLMDVSLGIDSSLDEKKQKSIEKYEEAINNNLPYFVLNFHDSYFSTAYPSMKAWYEWFIRFLAQQQTFISFEDAIHELNG